MIDIKSHEPYINVWFGNFYRPAYDDKEFVEKAIGLVKNWGFNSVLLDAKAWEDFRDRYEGKEASPYVEMIEYMQKVLQEKGLSHEFLALYLNADNLYPNIRFCPPIYGESVIDAEGRDGKWYRYWSDKAKASMLAHIKGLMTTYRENYVTVETGGEMKLPICSMWDPIVAPSFDDEGKNRYLVWLRDQYSNDISRLNQAYQTDFEDFDRMARDDYWYSCKYPLDITYQVSDIKNRTPKCILWADNMKWKKHELIVYFEDMQSRLKKFSPDLFLCPDMAQWSYFLNIDGSMLTGVGMSDLWDTAIRGINIYELAPYVDSCHFITVPVTPYGDPDAYVVSCQHSMMRTMNEGREFIGGIYWGRFLYNDVYEVITPCETVGSMVANGISGYSSYGMCGLDDGGVLHRMDKAFTMSLTRANEWAKQVIPILGRKKKQLAILFPSAMSTYETMQVEGNKERRIDLLGWYKLCCDIGYEADVIDINMIAGGRLKDYEALIIPADDCYFLEPNQKAENILSEWVKSGGIILHGPDAQIIEGGLEIKKTEHNQDSIFFQEGIMVQGNHYCSYEGDILAEYMSDHKGCVVHNKAGKGHIYSFGFYYGYSYHAKIAPHVPLAQKNNELYPVPMMKRQFLDVILSDHCIEKSPFYGHNIEVAAFDNGYVIVNHTSHPVELLINGEKLFQYPSQDNVLMARSAVFVYS